MDRQLGVRLTSMGSPTRLGAPAMVSAEVGFDHLNRP